MDPSEIRQQIDRLTQTEPQLDAGLDTEIETLIAQLRGKNPKGQQKALLREVNAELASLKRNPPHNLACPNCHKPYQVSDTFCSGCGQSLAELQANSCPQCGHPFQPDDAFCTKCGAALELETQNIPTLATEPSL